MKAFDAYKKYVAIKLHFHSDYDYFKFAGKANVSRESFSNRKDRHIFERLAKVYDAEQFETLLVANFLTNSEVWIGDIASENGRRKYLDLKKKFQSLQYQFKQDIEKLKDEIDRDRKTFDSLFHIDSDESCYPKIVDMMVQQDITIETFVLMNKILNFMPKISKRISDDLVWPEIRKLVTKYSPFVRVDLKPFRTIMKSTFLDVSGEKTLAASD
jgi:T4 gene Gp59 loader of gp41 DNA helicase/T4 gene Gp59 loader of gp41 DNA helicase C-term